MDNRNRWKLSLQCKNIKLLSSMLQIARPKLGFNGFDGIDWDIEGVNDLASPDNEITPACIRLMGELSQKVR